MVLLAGLVQHDGDTHEAFGVAPRRVEAGGMGREMPLQQLRQEGAQQARQELGVQPGILQGALQAPRDALGLGGGDRQGIDGAGDRPQGGPFPIQQPAQQHRQALAQRLGVGAGRQGGAQPLQDLLVERAVAGRLDLRLPGGLANGR